MRNHVAVKRVTTVIPALLIMTALFIYGCDSSSSSSSSPAPKLYSTMAGSAYADKPLKGSKVTLTTYDGTVIYEKERATNAHGVFTLEPASTPQGEFLVVVTGGTVYDPVTRKDIRPFNDMIVKRVGTHYSLKDFLVVNPVTTLTALYHAVHPDMSNSQVIEKVKKFLRFPDSYRGTLNNDVKWAYFHFSLRGFVDKARESAGGNIDMALYNYVKGLIAAIDRGDTVHYRLKAPERGLRSIAPPDPDSIGDITKSLFSTIIGKTDPVDLAVDSVGFFTSWLAQDLTPGPSLDTVVSQLQQIEAQMEQIETQLANIQANLTALTREFQSYEILSTAINTINTVKPDYSDLQVAWSTYEAMLQQASAGSSVDVPTYVTSMMINGQVCGAGEEVSSSCSCATNTLSDIISQQNSVLVANSPLSLGPNFTLYNLMLKWYMLNDSFINASQTTPYVPSTLMNSISNIYGQYSTLFYETQLANYQAFVLQSEVTTFCNNAKYPGIFQNQSQFTQEQQQDVNSDFNLISGPVQGYLTSQTAEFWRGVEAIRQLNPAFWHDSPNSNGVGNTPSGGDYRTNAYALALTNLGMAPAHALELQIPYGNTTSYQGSVFQQIMTATNQYTPLGIGFPSNSEPTLTYKPFMFFTDYFVAPTMSANNARQSYNGQPWIVTVQYNLDPNNDNLQWPQNNYVPHVAFISPLPASGTPLNTVLVGNKQGAMPGPFYQGTPFLGSDAWYPINLDSNNNNVTTLTTLTDPSLYGSYVVLGIQSMVYNITNMTPVGDWTITCTSSDSKLTAGIGFDMSDASNVSTSTWHGAGNYMTNEPFSSNNCLGQTTVLSNYMNGPYPTVWPIQIAEQLTQSQQSSSSALPAESNGNVNIGITVSFSNFSGKFVTGHGGAGGDILSTLSGSTTLPPISVPLPVGSLTGSSFQANTFQSAVTMGSAISQSFNISGSGLTATVDSNFTLNYTASLL